MSALAYALRGFLRHRGLTVAVVVTLGLALGANTAVFSLVNAVLLRPLPVAEQERLVFVDRRAADQTLHGFSYGDYRELRTAAADVVQLAATRDHAFVLDEAGGARLVGGLLVSGNYFDVLGVRPHLGRALGAADEGSPGSNAVVVIGHALWQRAFAADPRVIGRTLRLNRHPFTIVGVAPPGFQGHFVGFPFELWVPLGMAGQVAASHTIDSPAAWLELLGRLGPGQSADPVRDRLRGYDAALPPPPAGAPRAQASVSPTASPGFTPGRATHDGERAAGARDRGHRIDLRPMTGLDEELRGPVQTFLGVFEGAALLMLVAACANVATLLLVRANARRQEIGIRLALGASRGRLVRQLFTETLLLFAAGAAAGLALARTSAGLLMEFQPRFALPLRLDLGLDARVVAFSVALTLGAALAFGIGPALQAARVDLGGVLKETAGSTTGRGRVRRALVFAQVAASVVLLVLSGAFLRSMQRALRADVGFDAQGVALASIHTGLVGYDEAAGRAFHADLLERVARLPGVQAAALAQRAPLGLGRLTTEIRMADPAHPDGRPLTVDFNATTPGYLGLLRIPVRAGRDFEKGDSAQSMPVAIVNDTLAESLWPGREPLGRHVWHAGRQRRVVGVARNSAYRRPGEPPRWHLYVPYAQSYSPAMTVLARGSGDSTPLVTALQAEVRALDAEVPVLAASTLRERLASSLAPHRMAAALAGAMGALALLLAGVGLYGVVSFSVGRRTREFGLRSALGASPSGIARHVLGEALRVAAPAALVGLAAAALATLAISRLLPGVGAADTVTIAVVAAVLATVTLLACAGPARRAARIDPAAALRHH